MNWEALSAVGVVLSGVGVFANYLMMMSIKVALAEQSAELKEWVRKEFAAIGETERRLAALERAFGATRED